MVKTVRSVPHRGLRDWILQRLSAVMIVAYALWLMATLVCETNLTFAEWHHLFSLASVKIATILFLAALIIHAWIGIWTILTDYVKPILLRGVLYLVIVFMLIAFFIWGLLILGSV